jgi:hypothetical protein
MAALVEHGIVLEYHVWGGHLDVDRAIGRLLTKLGCSNGVVIVMGFVCSVWFVCFLRFFPFYLLFFNLFACLSTIYSQSDPSVVVSLNRFQTFKSIMPPLLLLAACTLLGCVAFTEAVRFGGHGPAALQQAAVPEPRINQQCRAEFHTVLPWLVPPAKEQCKTQCVGVPLCAILTQCEAAPQYHPPPISQSPALATNSR